MGLWIPVESPASWLSSRHSGTIKEVHNGRGENCACGENKTITHIFVEQIKQLQRYFLKTAWCGYKWDMKAEASSPDMQSGDMEQPVLQAVTRRVVQQQELTFDL